MWPPYFDEITKLAEVDLQQEVEDIAEKEAKRVARRSVKRMANPTYDNLLRALAKGIRKAPIKMAASDMEQAGQKAQEAAKTMGQSLGHAEAHMLVRRGIKTVAEPGYVHFLEMLARQAKKMPIPKVAAAVLAHHHRFQGQMNRFLKDLMKTKRSPANIFGERAKRPLHQIHFPQFGGKPGA